ncbi:MAG: Gfo/Idh/MocA family protein [Promethearchaeota archaeon]
MNAKPVVHEPLGVAFLGVGPDTGLQLASYGENPRAVLVATCDPRAGGNGGSVTTRGREIPQFSDYGEMLERPGIDVVEVATPPDQHLEQVLACVEAGVRGISVRTPVACSISECDAMARACEDAGVLLKVDDTFAFHPPFKLARDLLERGILGEVISLRVKAVTGVADGLAGEAGGTEPSAPDGNQGGGLGGEPCGLGHLVSGPGNQAFSIATWLTGEEVDVVYAWIGKPGYPAHVMWKYKESPKQKMQRHYGTMEFDACPELAFQPGGYPADEFVEVSASHGVMWVNQGSVGGRPVPGVPAFPPISVYREGRVEVYGDDLPLDPGAGHAASVDEFLECVRRGTTPDFSSAWGRKHLQFVLAALKSNRERAEVRLDDIDGQGNV